MPEASPGPDLLQSLNVLGDFLPQVSFYFIIGLDYLLYLVQLIGRKILGPLVGIYLGRAQDYLAGGKPDAIKVRQSVQYLLIIRNVES